MSAAQEQTPPAETTEGVNPAAEAVQGGAPTVARGAGAADARPQNCPRCFIVRVPPDLDADLAAYRERLSRERGRPVSLASVARKLLRRGLDVSTPARRRLPESPQLALFGAPTRKAAP